jgi:hypothetical protein
MKKEDLIEGVLSDNNIIIIKLDDQKTWKKNS